ncbi:MAG TPA: VTT domain-containing protein [Anaeromyxobacteraceae bacterium]|nr:VTT domain-containing protein [Anaeromyxobacteraceae bacterium]
MEDLILGLSGLPSWQLALAATWLLLQACVIPSPPEEIVIASLGMLASQGRISFPLAFVAVLCGLLPSNAAAVFIGDRLARGLAVRGPFARTLASAPAQDALASVRRHGRALVFVTRFTPLVRGPVYLAAGASRLGLARFAPVDAAAACLQVPLLLWLGGRVGRGAGSLAAAWQRLGMLLAALLAVGLAVQGVRWALGRRRKVAPALPRLTG